MYAREDISKGEVVYIKGGHDRGELFSSSEINSYLPISDDFFVGAVSSEEETYVKLYNNHSCDPNCGMHGEITFITIKDIRAGEELTVDYSFECHCGSPISRNTVTDFDWKIKELQNKYYPYFAQYLKDKIDLQRSQNEEIEKR